MTGLLVLKAMLLGLMNAAPIGPVGLLCLKKNVDPDRKTGLCAALGMAVAYAVIAFCVLFGLKAIREFLENYRVLFQIVGGVALVVMGWRSWKSPPVAKRETAGHAVRYLGDFSASFAMTLFNPVPFASFAVILTTFKVVSGHLDLASDLYFAAWVGVGTILFWLAVNQILHMAKKRSPFDLCRLISRGSAIAMFVFGVAIAVAAFF